MKKMYWIAVAAMVSLSSCVQTDEVYTGQNQEMGFNSAVTRGIIDSQTDMTYPIAVTAVLDDTDDSTDNYATYFESAKFVYDAGTQQWKGEPARYWPTSGDMDFLAFCPYPTVATITNNYNASTGLIENMVIGKIDNNIKEQHDVLFSDLLSVEAPQTAAQPLLFHHACAQLNVTFKKTDSAAAVVVKSVKVKDANLSGILTVSPVKGGTSTAAWSDPYEVDRFFLPEDATGIEDINLDYALESGNAASPTPLLVLPSAQTAIEIAYTIDGHDEVYTHDLSVNADNWEMGYKYTYNYTINVNEIIFECTVEDWVVVDGGSVTI